LAPSWMPLLGHIMVSRSKQFDEGDGGGSDRGAAEDGFRFATNYSSEEVFCDAARRRQFFNDFLRWEGRFLQTGVGISDSGLTFDGAHILSDGRLETRSHSNPSKEALHLALLALAASQDGLPGALLRDVGGAEEALRQLRQKAAALERYRKERPELGGFMPWFDAPSCGQPVEPEVAVCYNGMLAWSLYFVARSLSEIGETDLAERFELHLQSMREAAVRLSYKGSGKVAARFSVAPRGGGTASKSEQSCEDPFAGELFCMFLDLLGDWSVFGDAATEEKEAMWDDPDRCKWLGWSALEVTLEGSTHLIGAMPRSTFSVHEEWKHLLLPYDEVPAARRAQCAAERLRSWWARAEGLPGLLGDCHVASADGGTRTCHVASFGIPGAVSLRLHQARQDHVAGCGAFALLLADPATGAAWLHETLCAHTGMQTQWGMAESCAADRSEICPLLTWDAKATTSLAVLGGLGSQMRRFLERDVKLERFSSILNRLYGTRACGDESHSLSGELLGFAPPASVGTQAWSPGAAVSACEEASLELQLAKAARCDAPRILAARRWFDCHESEPGAPYCTGKFYKEPYSDWYTPSTRSVGHYAAASEKDRLALYESVVSCFKLGVPLVLLARQPERYPLFFDLDVYGGCEDAPNFDKVIRFAWEDEEQVLSRAIVSSVWDLYPELRGGLEVAVFSSNGLCRRKKRFKASYHLVFKDIIVDRPEKCTEASGKCGQRPAARHIAVRNHMVCRLSDAADAGGALADLRDDLRRCCDSEVVSESDDDVTYLNDWTEILDEFPLWHEPGPDAATGLRLPFTDKPREGRPKLPLGRWRFSSATSSDVSLKDWPPKCSIEQLRDLDLVKWVRLGDISADVRRGLTPWSEEGLHPDALSELECPECWKDADCI